LQVRRPNHQQLAAGFRAVGDKRQARETLMAQRDDQLARTHTLAGAVWGRITKITLGYAPSRGPISGQAWH